MRTAREKLQARIKLIRVLPSEAVNETPLAVGDLVEVYQKKGV